MRYTRSMPVLRAMVWLCAVALLVGLPAGASVVPLEMPAVPALGKITAPSAVSDSRTMRESLSRDIARHPGDFVVFAEHPDTVEQETNMRAVSRGVMGYWRGKTIVVLPWGPSARF